MVRGSRVSTVQIDGEQQSGETLLRWLPRGVVLFRGVEFHVYELPSPPLLGSTIERRYAEDLGIASGTLYLDGAQYIVVRCADPRAARSLPFKSECGLTNREQQIASLVADGFGNKSIASALGISKSTVATHLRRIFAKLNVTTRAAMVRRALRAIGDL